MARQEREGIVALAHELIDRIEGRAEFDLMADYARTDSWDVVEALPAGSTLDVVIGGRSEVFSESDRARIEHISTLNSAVSTHVLDDAGHWVHVDAADALVTLLTSPRTPHP